MQFGVMVVTSSLVGATAGPARIGLGHDLVFESPRWTIRLPYMALTGSRFRDGLVTLVAGEGGAIDFTTDDPRAFLAALVEHACLVPELTLAMRSLGGRHAGPATEHDRFYRPLLDARAAAERALDPSTRRSAFNARSLARGIRETISAIAAERNPKNAPHRRAMEAQLEEFAVELLRAIERLERHQAAVDDPVGAWCAWASDVRALFLEADRFWQRVRSLLDTQRIPAPSSRKAAR